MKRRLLVVGAGRIGAGFAWHDDAYTHAGAAHAHRDRVQLVGFVETDIKRAVAAKAKWCVPVYEDIPTALFALKADVVSVCTPPEDHVRTVDFLSERAQVEGIWVEKPFDTNGTEYRATPPWVQVNYMRRADPLHRKVAQNEPGGILTVYGKNDVHTVCHFKDLARWWKAKLDYRTFDGPCAYIYGGTGETRFFDKGGVDGGECFRGMLGNLLNAMDGKERLWSPPA